MELGFFKEEGLDAELELIYPVGKCYEALRDGKADFVGGSSHSVPTAFPEWQGVKFLGALAQRTYWFLIMRTDLNVKRGDVSAVKGKQDRRRADDRHRPQSSCSRRAASIPSGTTCRSRRRRCRPVPNVSFGVNAAKAMEDGKIDGFWANGMGAEVAVQRGIGTLVLDARRGDGPASLRGYTFGVLATRADLVEKQPDKAAAAVRALVKTQKALKADPKRATKVGEKWFPAFEASLIAKLVERDLPYYDPAISKGAFDSMCKFAQTTGLTKGVGRYEDVVATQFANLWKS